MRCVELCAGMGGLSLGVRLAGFEHLACIESDDECVATLAKNGWTEVRHACVQDVDFRDFQNVDLLSGGIPCQPFSTMGKQKGKSDERNLWPEVLRAIDECRPRALLFENVANLMSKRHRPYLDEVLATLQVKGYDVGASLVNSADFGVPQSRRRVIISGVQRGLPRPEVQATQTDDPVTVRTALASLPLPKGPLPRGGPRGERNWDAPDHVLSRAHARRYRNREPSLLDKPARTVVAGTSGSPGGMNMLQLDDGSLRFFTMRELARLQGFPDEYRLHPVKMFATKQLGNAMPPPLAHAVALAIRASLSAATSTHADEAVSGAMLHSLPSSRMRYTVPDTP